MPAPRHSDLFAGGDTPERAWAGGAAQMEVGIEDCLHIDFEYDKSKYHLKDTVVGKIYFLLARPRRRGCMHCTCMPGVCRPCYNGLPAVAGTPCAPQREQAGSPS